MLACSRATRDTPGALAACQAFRTLCAFGTLWVRKASFIFSLVAAIILVGSDVLLFADGRE